MDKAEKTQRFRKLYSNAGEHDASAEIEAQDWAGRGFTGPPAEPDPGPSQLRTALRKILSASGMMTLAQVEQHFALHGRAVAGSARRDLIAELASMRDDGEVRFEGPRYVWNG